MQIKTIKKTIINKLTEWLNSIDDEFLRTKVKNNLLLSGGSITSMFLNLDINDYDIYIKDMDVLLELTKYYTKNFDDKIKILDGRLKEKYIDELREDAHSAYEIAVKNLSYDQIKLFFIEKNGGMLVEIENKDKKYQPAYFSPNAISLTDNIQIVIRFHGNNEDIHKTFDFIHATNYFTFEEGLVTNIKALESILTKQLFYQGSLYPLTSIIRMKKFIKRQWNINAGEILKIMFQISLLDLKDPDVLAEQLIGVDVAYFDKLIEILRGVEPEKLTSTYLNTIIDKVFNEYDDNEE
ncbi:MAG: hypothetical protein PHF86_00435 [Candidatus Nanoarchaeia archaeon]|jgi:hypothetical protein|nr:hypothetical protein [Candidatus Nanoarchaeia archaeon]